MNWLTKMFNKEEDNTPARIVEKNKRRHISEVKPGEMVVVQWTRIREGTGSLKCLNNDPQTKTIWLEVRWNNYKETNCVEFEKFVLTYDDPLFMNFHLLNALIPKSDEEEEDDIIEELNSIIHEALEKEEYETIARIKNKIAEKINLKIVEENKVC